MMDIPPPPAIYDHVYRGALDEHRGTLAQVEDYCHAQHGLVSAYQALGCAQHVGNACVIMIPRVGGRITPHVQAQIRRHELAHCNGWPENHPR